MRWSTIIGLVALMAYLQPGLPALGVGAAAIVITFFLGPAKDPDFERKIQRHHGAEYFLNGGEFAGGKLPNSERLPPGTGVYLLIRGEHLLIVRQDLPGEVHSGIAIGSLERISVDEETYVPVYVSEAKDPPVRDESADPQATAELRLERPEGERLAFTYKGVFAAHLAGTAAHAIHSVREQLRRPTGEPTLHVLRA